jgi:hypothetical protein
VAAPTFGAEGTDGRAPATKVRTDQGRDALAGDIASGACGGAGRASDEARRFQSRVAASSPKARRSWTRGCRRLVKWALDEAETRAATCKGVSVVRRHAGGLYDAGTYCYTLVKCLKQVVRNGKGVIEANDYTQGSPINSEPLVMKRTHCNEKRALKAPAGLSVFGLLSIVFVSFTILLSLSFSVPSPCASSSGSLVEASEGGRELKRGCCVGVHPSGPIPTNTI